VVTSIGIDHKAWLGSDPERIAEEKAAICRDGCPLILADRAIPKTADQLAKGVGAVVYRENQDYQIDSQSQGLSVTVDTASIKIPTLGIPSVPVTNAAAAVVAAKLLQPRLGYSDECVAGGIANARLIGRGQQFELLWQRRSLLVTLDVAHNPDSAEALARRLVEIRSDRAVALCAMLADKDCAEVYKKLNGVISTWHLAGLHGQRGQTAQSLAAASGNQAACLHHDLQSALPLVLDQMVEDNQHTLVVFGSFETVAAALTWCRAHERSDD
jgi:dihydrofolate synthase/folylpolyglutamate synthase